MRVLGIGLDYLMISNPAVRGDVMERQRAYSRQLASLDLVVYAPRSQGLPRIIREGNLTIHTTASRSKGCYIIDAYRAGKAICREKMIDVITTEDPFVTGFVGLLLSMGSAPPLSVQVHTDFVNNPEWQRKRAIHRFFHVLGKFVCRRADTIRVVAQATREKLEREGVAASRISVIPVHSNARKFATADGTLLRKSLGDDGFNRVALFAGRMATEKNIPNLLKAWSLVVGELSDSVLLLAGDGPEKPSLETMARKEGLWENVRFLGAVPHDRLADYYSAADVFVLPSNYEGRPTVVVEAVLSSRPVVCTSVSGVSEWIREGENGFIVERNSPRMLAEKVAFLLRDLPLARAMGRKGYLMVSDWAESLGDTNDMIDLWRCTVSRGGRKRPGGPNG